MELNDSEAQIDVKLLKYECDEQKDWVCIWYIEICRIIHIYIFDVCYCCSDWIYCILFVLENV